MLDAKSLFAIQSKYGVGESVHATDMVDYNTYLNECRRFMNDKTPREYHTWKRKRQDNFTETIIIQFANSNKKSVKGYLNKGILDIVKLIDDLKIDIMDFGILRRALDDESVQEIQINDYRSIWIVKGGKTELYRDENGDTVKFNNNDEIYSVINRMTFNPTGDSPRMTVSDPLFNARASRSGYRISGVDMSAITPDKPPYDFPVTGITIRKYSSSRLTFDDFIRYNTIPKEGAKLLRLFGFADCRLFCVGPTSSGKTTLLNSVLWETPKDLRVILIQNPTEILLYDRDFEGVNRRNVLHWEAESMAETDISTKPTQSNMISHSLRNTPDIIVPGEARIASEFYEIYRALLTGHRVLGTFHSDTAEGAAERMANEIASACGGSRGDYIQSICSFLDIIVAQYKLADGSRRVMEISELTGNLTSKGTAEVNTIIKFVLGEEHDRDENGVVTKIRGHFVQTGVLSERTKEKMYKAGINKSEIEEFINEKYIGRTLLEV